MSAPETFCLLPFGAQVLALTAQEFQAALERGLALTGSTVAPPVANGDAPHLCTAAEMESLTGVKAAWFLEAARAGQRVEAGGRQAKRDEGEAPRLR